MGKTLGQWGMEAGLRSYPKKQKKDNTQKREKLPAVCLSWNDRKSSIGPIYLLFKTR